MLPSDNLPADRLVMHRLGDDNNKDTDETGNQFAADVRRGLSSTPKILYPKYFYDELGSQLFDAICLLPEYYLTRAEEEILSQHAHDIVRAAKSIEREGNDDAPLALIEFGSGSAIKTQRIIEAAFRVQTDLALTSIDISASALERSARVLLQSYPGLRLTALAGDYDAALDFLRRHQTDAHNATHTRHDTTRPRTLALFLGSNIGNFNYDEAIAFLRRLRTTLRAGDALLLGADLRKDPKLLEAAYDDALGVTGAFNLNILNRINRELDGDFQLADFRHVARYDDAEGSVKIYIESMREQIVRLARLEMNVEFVQGERIHTENSHKYDHATLSAMAHETGFRLAQTWHDRAAQFSSNLFVAVA